MGKAKVVFLWKGMAKSNHWPVTMTRNWAGSLTEELSLKFSGSSNNNSLFISIQHITFKCNAVEYICPLFVCKDLFEY